MREWRQFSPATLAWLVMLATGVCSEAFGNQPTPSEASSVALAVPGVEMVADGKIARIQWGTARFKLNLTPLVDAVDVDQCAVLAALGTKDGIFFVLRVSGGSRDNGGQGYCGCGIESNLIWLQLDANGKIVASDSVLFESCFKDDELVSDVTNKNGVLDLVFTSYRDKCRTTVTFNTKVPEKGFTRVNEPLNP